MKRYGLVGFLFMVVVGLGQIVPAQTPIGCFKDSAADVVKALKDRDLNAWATKSPSMTGANCISACASKGYKYAGTQAGAWCMCGNAYGKFGAATNCNTPCAADASSKCGGTLANTVYQVPAPNPIGCFKDNGNDRDLNGFIGKFPTMDGIICGGICKSKGFKYAGTQAGTWCLCGNTYGKFGPATNCDANCSGDAKVKCGGAFANTVYQTPADYTYPASTTAKAPAPAPAPAAAPAPQLTDKQKYEQCNKDYMECKDNCEASFKEKGNLKDQKGWEQVTQCTDGPWTQNSGNNIITPLDCLSKVQDCFNKVCSGGACDAEAKANWTYSVPMRPLGAR